MASTSISKETVHRLLKDVTYIIKNPLHEHGIYYHHDEVDMLKGYALVVGPADTPYYGGYYFFQFQFPTDYPYSPPKITYLTNDDNVRFNPNLYKTGKVCISVLNTWRGESWSSCQSIHSVLLALCTVLNKEPLLNEPGIKDTHPDFHRYTQAIEFINISFCICDMITKKSIPKEFDFFYEDMVKHFLNNYSTILDFLKEKEQKIPTKQTITISFYNFSVSIHYGTLLQKWIQCKEYVDQYIHQSKSGQAEEQKSEEQKSQECSTSSSAI